MTDEPPVVKRVGTRNLLLLTAAALIALAGGCMLLRANAVRGKPVATAPIAIPVNTQKAAISDLPIERTGLGAVTPINIVDVKARVDGYLQRIAFADGQEVKSGDVLAEIDPRPYQALLEQAQALLQRDNAQLASALREEARATRLSATGAGSLQASDLAKAAVAATRAAVAGDQAAVDTATLNVSFSRILAPFDGRVGLRQVSAGALVHANDTVGVITITQMRPIAVQFALPQDDLPDLSRGLANGDLPVAVATRDGATRLATGKLAAIDNQIDPATGMIKVKAVFENVDGALWPGELVSAHVRIRTDSHAIVVPSAAIQNGQNGSYVFVVKSGDTVSLAPVKVGPVAGDVTAILSGVAPGDDVVVAGQSRLAEGAKVTPNAGAAAAIASAASTP